MIDLHLHTDMSDGSDSPLELLGKVVAAGCGIFSVTDHDDLRANNIILSAMSAKAYGVKFLTGCEISSVFEERNLHLLCYGFRPDGESVNAIIAEGAKMRRQRIAAMFDHLRIKHGIVIPDVDRVEILSRAVPGKVHIADAAMRLGVNMERQEFFDNCLDDMESREFKLTADRVIDAVSRSGGVVSWAHPVEVQREYGIDVAEIAGMAARLRTAGLAGLEVYHSLHGEYQIKQYAEIARACGLLVSGGSDYHGKNKKVAIGQLSSCGFAPSDGEITIASRL